MQSSSRIVRGICPRGWGCRASACLPWPCEPIPTIQYSKILIVAGGDGDQALIAAQAVASAQRHAGRGDWPASTASNCRPSRKPDAAPRWARTDQKIALWDYASSDQLQGDGTAPLNVYFRIPPDIFPADRPNAVLKLVYRYNSIPIGPISSLQVRINNAFLGSTPADSRAGSFAKDGDRGSGAGSESAPVLQLAFIRFHISSC
jgi:hypothetical protein